MRSQRRVDLLIIVSWFIASRLLAFALGVQPDLRIPDITWQLLPNELLETRFLDSLWYLHSQPPLFNAFIGLLLKLPGDHLVLWRLIWVVMGLAFPLTMFTCLRLVDARRVVAHFVTAAIALNPTFLLYENFLFYSYPEALCVLVAFAGLLAAGYKRGGWLTFSASASALTLFRSAFQPLWAIGIAVAAGWSFGRRLKAAQRMALVAPAMLATVVVVKNGLMFGVWTSSSWYGMNMTQLAATAVSEEIPRLAQAGKVSSLFAVGSFRPASDYPAAMVERAVAEAHREFGGPAALTVQRKLNGDPNFNHLFYRDLSRQLMADSIAAAQERPDLLGRQILQGLRIFFQPASFYPYLSGNRERLYLFDVAYFAVAYPMGTFLLVQIALVAGLVSSGVIAIRRQSTAALRPAAAYVFVTVAWVATVGNIAEYGENMRFRFTVDPLILLWLAIVFTQLAPKLMLENRHPELRA